MQETVGSWCFDFALFQFFCGPFPEKCTFFWKMAAKKWKSQKLKNRLCKLTQNFGLTAFIKNTTLSPVAQNNLKCENVQKSKFDYFFKIPNNLFVLHNLMRTYQIPGILGQNGVFRLKMQFLRVSENIYLRSRFLEK